MKKLIGIALVLALALGIAAFAETAADPAPAGETPAVTEQAPAATAEVTKVEDDSAALNEAMDAYRSARQQKAVTDLETELNGYVADGSLTQEQADLILNNAKERMAAKNGQCPNCGYQFQGRGGMMDGQMRGNRMGGQMRGGMRHGQMNGMQQPDIQSGAIPQMPQQPQM